MVTRSRLRRTIRYLSRFAPYGFSLFICKSILNVCGERIKKFARRYDVHMCLFSKSAMKIYLKLLIVCQTILVDNIIIERCISISILFNECSVYNITILTVG